MTRFLSILIRTVIIISVTECRVLNSCFHISLGLTWHVLPFVYIRISAPSFGFLEFLFFPNALGTCFDSSYYLLIFLVSRSTLNTLLRLWPVILCPATSCFYRLHSSYSFLFLTLSIRIHIKHYYICYCVQF
jgi:hypothetical protein